MIAARIVRALLAGVGLGIVGAVCIYSAAKIADPLVLLHGQRVELDALKRQSEALAAQERRVRQRLIYFSSEDGRTQRLHEMGLLLPGERFVRIVPSGGSPRPAARKAEPSAIDRVRSAAMRLGKRIRQAVSAGRSRGAGASPVAESSHTSQSGGAS